MTPEEYDALWSGIGFDPARLDEPARTLARHVLALMDRVDSLPTPDVHDKEHGRTCRCYITQCACAYDHPDAVCMVHAPATGGVITGPIGVPWLTKAPTAAHQARLAEETS